jgi:hypothetical protein
LGQLGPRGERSPAEAAQSREGESVKPSMKAVHGAAQEASPAVPLRIEEELSPGARSRRKEDTGTGLCVSEPEAAHLGMPPEGRGRAIVRPQPEPEPEPKLELDERETPELSQQYHHLRVTLDGTETEAEADAETQTAAARRAEENAGARATEAWAKAEAARKIEQEQLKRLRERAAARKAQVDGAAFRLSPVPLRYPRTKDTIHPDITEEDAEKDAAARKAKALAEAAAAGKMGAFCAKHGRYNEALVFYQKAADVQLAELGREHPALGSTWNRLGGVYEKQEQFVEAMRHYQMAADTELSPLASGSVSGADPCLSNASLALKM